MNFSAILAETGIIGAQVNFVGFPFLLALTDLSVDRTGTLFEHARHRPRQLRVKGEDAEIVIDFGWFSGDTVNIGFTGSGAAEANNGGP